MRHIVIISETQIGSLLKGKVKYLIFPLKKRQSFLEKVNPGDTVFYRSKKSSLLGQFIIQKAIIFLGSGEGGILEIINQDIEPGFRVILIIYIDKLEQLITSPVEIDRRVKKEWSVLE